MKYGIMESLFFASLITAVIMLCSLSGAVGFYAIFGFGDEDPLALPSRAKAAHPDPNTLPAPAAGYPAQQANGSLSCEGVVYRTSENGIRYVREAGGGIYHAAIIHDRLGIYKISYGQMEKVEPNVLDPASLDKLSNALRNCKGPFLPSGTRFAHSLIRKPRA
jgi:hypothetical protein